MATFDVIYKKLLKNILKDGIEDTNKRTGHKTKAIPGATFSTDIEKDGFPLLTLRKVPIRAFVAEQIWFISGARKPADFLREYTKIWDVFTNPNDVVTVAYGYRWRKFFGRDQLGLLIKHLKKDPSSRHGVIVTWDPGSDGLGGIKRANVPCPYTFTINVIGGRVHMHNIVRSNDVILGLPFDVAGFALLQTIIAQELGFKPGIYTHTISNAHIYDLHYEGAKEMIKRPTNHKPIKLLLPKNSFSLAEKQSRKLADTITAGMEKQYAPGKPIKGLSIVL